MSRPDLKSTLAGLIIKDVQSVNGKKEFSVYNLKQKAEKTCVGGPLNSYYYYKIIIITIIIITINNNNDNNNYNNNK